MTFHVMHVLNCLCIITWITIGNVSSTENHTSQATQTTNSSLTSDSVPTSTATPDTTNTTALLNETQSTTSSSNTTTTPTTKPTTTPTRTISKTTIPTTRTNETTTLAATSNSNTTTKTIPTITPTTPPTSPTTTTISKTTIPTTRTNETTTPAATQFSTSSSSTTTRIPTTISKTARPITRTNETTTPAARQSTTSSFNTTTTAIQPTKPQTKISKTTRPTTRSNDTTTPAATQFTRISSNSTRTTTTTPPTTSTTTIIIKATRLTTRTYETTSPAATQTTKSSSNTKTTPPPSPTTTTTATPTIPPITPTSKRPTTQTKAATTPADCGNLTGINITNAVHRRLHTDTTFESTADIDCDDGYFIEGRNQTAGISTQQITCSDKGTWINMPVCVPKDCGKLDELNLTNAENRRLINRTTIYTSLANISCDEGYKELDSSQVSGITSTVIRCNENGTWENLPKCVRKACGNLENISLTNVNETNFMNGTVFTSIANISCDVGFKDKDGDQTEGTSTKIITCRESGDWTNLPTCVRKDCGSVTHLNISNANIRRQKNGTEYMSIAEIDCDTGFYNKNDNQTSEISTTNIKCSASGKWINMPTCVLKDCGKLSSPSNGIISYVSNMTTFASKAVYICDNGYQLNGSDTIECKDTGKWSDYTTYCQIKDCGVVLPPANGDIVLHQNSTVYGSNATYICDEGYNMIGQANIKCEASGDWDNKTTSCKIKDCDSPEGPTDGNATPVNGTTYLSIAKYVCNQGFDLNGSDTTICQANGSWSGRVPTCEIKNCGAIQNPTNGKVNTENGTEYKSVATFICETGYTLIGDNMTSCEPSGNWSIYSLNCTINDCGHPTKPMNGSVEISNGTTYQSLVTFKCDVGFEMNGTNTSECQANSKWSNEVPQCIIKDCGPRTKPINGSIEISNGTTYQSLMAFKCDVGFEMNGTNTSECQANSRWSNEVPKCNIKDCGDPKWPNQGKILSKTGNKYNDNVTYSCNQGYETSDPVLVTCNSSGNWSRPAPVCKDINECTRYTNDCHLQAICNNTDGSYKCQCREGFTDNSTNGQHGRDCQDINECADLKKIQCDKDRSRCVNYLGGHVCFCHQGWTGLHCENDIDECNDTSSCGVEAYCTNFYGGYNCTCKKNFPKGDPTFHCYENVIIELVTPVAPFRGDNELITSFPIHNRFPYFGTEYKSFRPNMNGFITLGFQPLYQNYGPETLTDWKTFSEGRTVIAPFWTNLDSTNLTGGVFVHLMEYYSGDMNDSRHKDLAMLGEIFSNNLNLTDFNPRVAIEATWLNVTKSSYIIPTRLIKSQNVTMQLILISDGIYSYLMFNYDHEQWSLKLDKNIPSSAGFSCKDNNVHILATSKNASSLNNDTNVQSGPNGRWIFDVTDHDPDKIAVLTNESECLNFIKNDTIRKWIARQRLLSYACPCVQQQMDLDYSYRIVEPMYEHSSPKPTCYEAWFFNNDGVKQTCCYSYGALKKDFIGGGFATFEPDTYNIIQYFYMCCDSNNDRYLCRLFYEMNPPDDCSRFQPADEPVSRHKRSFFGVWNSGACKLCLNDLYMIVLLVFVQIIN